MGGSPPGGLTSRRGSPPGGAHLQGGSLPGWAHLQDGLTSKGAHLQEGLNVSLLSLRRKGKPQLREKVVEIRKRLEKVLSFELSVGNGRESYTQTHGRTEL